MKIKLYSWSHCSKCWVFYAYVDSKEEANKLIKRKGFNPKYFKLD